LSYIRIKLKPKEEDRILAGHPWVYANEVEKVPAHLAQGSLVEVITSKAHFVGRGVANPSSKILARLLTHSVEEEVGEQLIVGRARRALGIRAGMREKYSTDSLRLFFGEADGLPGVIADSFGEGAVLSCFSAGMKPFLPVLVKTLLESGIRFVYEKSVGETCVKEGMSPFEGWLTEAGSFPLEIKEGPARFRVWPDKGHKTGFYLDFREARARLRELSRGKKVLDAFCYTGASAIQAALGGATQVTAVESSQEALEEAAENARLNGVEKAVQFEKNDTFKALREFKKEGRSYDGIVLDPPPLAKSVHDLPNARNALQRLVSQALDLLTPGGFLVTATCSHHFPWTVLEGVVREAAEDSGRSFRLVERLTQPPDHPVVLSIPETEYLRALVLQEISG
jgi:23S rRNA (cytosine1962-C5)-methyltransferase